MRPKTVVIYVSTKEVNEMLFRNEVSLHIHATSTYMDPRCDSVESISIIIIET